MREHYWRKLSRLRSRPCSVGHADETTDDGRKRLVRHGHLPEREIMTGIGPGSGVRCPRVRDASVKARSAFAFPRGRFCRPTRAQIEEPRSADLDPLPQGDLHQRLRGGARYAAWQGRRRAFGLDRLLVPVHHRLRAPRLPDADHPSHSTLTASHETSQLPTRSFCA